MMISLKNSEVKILKKLMFILGSVLIITGCSNSNEEDNDKEVKAVTSENIEQKAEKPKEVTIEERSKKFIDENLEGKTIADFNKTLIMLDDKELFNIIILGHKDGQQIIDDFDIIGRQATATGVITEFTEVSFNTYNDRGKKSGSVTEVRTDKFYIYMGEKDIFSYEYIEYDNLIHKDRDKNEFFLGVYPEEIINFAIIDLDEDADLKIGQQITVDGTITNYVIRKDYSDDNIVSDFNVIIENAHIK